MRALITLLVSSFILAAPLVVESAAAQSSADQETQLRAVFEAAKTVVVHGPSAVPLVDQATLQLPNQFAFVPSKQAQQILAAMGNRT